MSLDNVAVHRVDWLCGRGSMHALRALSVIGVACLCFGATAHSQTVLPTDVAVQRLDQLFAHREDYSFRARYAETLHSAPGAVAGWLDGLFFSVLHPLCPDGPCPDANVDAAERAAAFQKGAQAGNSHFQLIIGVYDLYGVGVDKDVARGVMWIEMAGASGDREAVYDLAQMYEVGELVPADEAKAIELYKVASQGTFAGPAMSRLGAIYEFGTGTGGVPDYRLALSWYERASAEHDRVFAKLLCPPCAGDPAAESLGILYAQGKGVARDYTAAARWFLKATNNGVGYGGDNWVAQCALAIMYAGGVGVKEDLQRSAFWLNRPNTRAADGCRNWPASRQ